MKKLMSMMSMILMAAMLSVIVGCQTATQPGRTNSQVTTVKENSQLTVDQSVKSSALVLPTVPAEGYGTNAFAQVKELVKLNAQLAGESNRTYGDVFTQNQMIETGGSEANSPTATSTPSVTTPIDVSWGNASTAGTSGFVSGVNAIWNWLKGGSNSGAAPTGNQAAGNSSGCSGGNCSDAGSGGCSTGNCSVR